MKNCHFCTNNVKKIDYKDAENLNKFLDHQAKIMPAKETGLCIKHQRRLAQAIKRSRMLGLLPFVRH
ncbi:MAG: 30S ribosomal protein S18 [Candidatus Pacebacteria bacterium]|nr:30S ribosomal protein S18 [Candidatus Paceibacterota bacterium]